MHAPPLGRLLVISCVLGAALIVRDADDDEMPKPLLAILILTAYSLVRKCTKVQLPFRLP